VDRLRVQRGGRFEHRVRRIGIALTHWALGERFDCGDHRARERHERPAGQCAIELVRTTRTTSLRVTISGTDITSTVDGSGQFTLNGVPPGNVTLQFSGSGVSASITLSGVTAGEQIHVEITLTNGGGAHVDSETRHRDDNGREVEGHITAINASARNDHRGVDGRECSLTPRGFTAARRR
jgi:hypothetical protein